MAWFGFPYAATEQMRRLDAAAAVNIEAQVSLQREGDQTAASAKKTRGAAVIERRRTQIASRAMRERPLRTSEVRDLVDEMLTRMDESAEHRAQRRH
ncbi:hypothetical protein ACFZ8E_05795 [Methylobacterium sp. HMF5984]|uniref:hypothetical protein n=1 Tax=Methylobacterium sp. HMF5984 TaxID=3367370 RepID=UPI003853EF43